MSGFGISAKLWWFKKKLQKKTILTFIKDLFYQ